MKSAYNAVKSGDFSFFQNWEPAKSLYYMIGAGSINGVEWLLENLNPVFSDKVLGKCFGRIVDVAHKSPALAAKFHSMLYSKFPQSDAWNKIPSSLENFLFSGNASAVKFFEKSLDILPLSYSKNGYSLVEKICGANGDPKKEVLIDVLFSSSNQKVKEVFLKAQETAAQYRLASLSVGSYGDSFLGFSKVGTGWISEDGALMSTRCFRHVEDLIKKIPHDHEVSIWLKEKSESLKEYISENQAEFEEDMARCGDCIGGGHNFEIWLDDTRYDFYSNLCDFLFNRGWIRVCMVDGVLHADGKSEFLDERNALLRDISFFSGRECGYKSNAVQKNVWKQEKRKYSIPSHLLS